MDNIDDENRAIETIAKGAGYVFVGVVISKLLSYAYRVIVARIGSEEYGLLSLGLAIVGILNIVPLLGLDQGVLRFVSYYLGKKEIGKAKSAIVSSLVISLPFAAILAVLLVIFSNDISVNFFRNAGLTPILQVLAISVPFLVVGNIFLSVIRAFKNAKYFSFIKNVNENLVKIIFTALLVICGFSVMGATLAHVIAIISTALVSFYFVKKKLFNIVVNDAKSSCKMGELLSYSFPLMLYALITQAIVWIGTIMIGFFRTESEVGIYNAALPTASLLSIVPEGIIALFIPVMASLLARKQMQTFEKAFKTSTNWVFIFNLPIFLLVILFSKQILNILFGANYVSGYLPLIILVVSYFVYYLFITSCQMLNILKKSKYLAINMFFAAVINIVLNYFLVPSNVVYGGIVGSAIASGVSLMLYGLLCGTQCYYFMRVSPFQNKQVKTALGGFIALAATYCISKLISPQQQQTYLALGSLAVFFVLVYGILILLFRCFNKEDHDMFNSVKSRIYNMMRS